MFKAVMPLLAVLLLLVGLTGSPVQAQPPGPGMGGGEIIQTPGQQSAGYSIGAVEPDYFRLNTPGQTTTTGDGGLGWLGRVNYQAGKTIGTEESLFNVSMMPYVFSDNNMLFGDVSIHRLNSGRAGGFAGLGFRHYFPGADRTFGLITSYGFDGAYKESFDNVTLGLESRGANFDVLSNIYFPVGNREQLIGLSFLDGTQEFVGNQVEFDQLRTTGYNLQGFDFAVGTPLPWEFTRQWDMRGYAGFYNFNHPDIDDIWGWSLSVEANALKYMDLDLNITHDDTFDTRVSLNASWTLDPRREYGERRTTWDRMLLPPSRLQTIPKAEVAVVEADQIAINPQTGNPYFVLHVDSATGVDLPGAGTVENPFNSIDNAISGGNAVPIDTYDIVFVHSGSTFDSAPTIVVPEGKRFLGEGDRVQHFIEYGEFGNQLFPRANGTYDDGTFDARPLYTNLGTPAGPGVTFDTLANLGGTVTSNSVTEFSGFVLGNPNGADLASGDSTIDIDPETGTAPGQGTSGNGIEFATLGTDSTNVRFVDIHGAEESAFAFENVTGDYLLESIIANQAGNHEMLVDGGSPDITVQSAIRGDTLLQTDSLIINRDNGSAGAPNGLGIAGDNHSLLVRNTTDGTVNWIDVVTDDDGGDGFLFTGSNSDITIPVSTTLNNTRAQSVFVAPGTDGLITLSSNRTDGNLGGAVFKIDNPGGGTLRANPDPPAAGNYASTAIQIGLPTNPYDPTLTTLADVQFLQPVAIGAIFNNADVPGVVTPGTLNRDVSGLVIADTSGSVNFFDAATLNIGYTGDNGVIGANNRASAIDIIQNSTGNIVFNNDVFIDNSGSTALRITNNSVNGADINQEATVRFFGGLEKVLDIDNPNVNERAAGAEGAAVVVGNDALPGPPSNGFAGTPYENEVQFDRLVDLDIFGTYAVFLDGNTAPVDFFESLRVDTNNIVGVSTIFAQNSTADIEFNFLEVLNFNNVDNPYVDPDDPTAAELAATFAAVDLRGNTGDILFRELIINDDIDGTALFAINNESITILSGSITTEAGTAVEIFTTDAFFRASQLAGLAQATDLAVNFDGEVNSNEAPDHGIFLANVKGSFEVTGGVIEDVGPVGVLTAPAELTYAGISIDNSELRDVEESEGFNLFQFDEFSARFIEMGIVDNPVGILGVDFDSLLVENLQFDDMEREAVRVENVVRAQIEGSTFTDNQNAFFAGLDVVNDAFGNEGATVMATYTRALNSDEQDNGFPQFYDFLVGTRSSSPSDFEDENQNQFSEDAGSIYAVLMVNESEADDNVIGELDADVLGTETGFVVNGNTFDRNVDSPNEFQSFVYYRGDSDATVNMHVANNVMTATLDSDDDDFNNAPVLGAIGFFHQSDANENDDDIVFTAIDNLMRLDDVGSVAYGFETRGDGNATIIVDDTFDLIDDFNLDGFLDEVPLLPIDQVSAAAFFANFNQGTSPDIQVNGTAFEFRLGTDAEVDILNTEILITDPTLPDISADRRGFVFENVRGDDTDINIAGNTLVFTSGLDFLTVEFDPVFGEAQLTSTADNNVFFFDGATTFTVFDPTFLFQPVPAQNVFGQFQFNNVFVP